MMIKKIVSALILGSLLFVGSLFTSVGEFNEGQAATQVRQAEVTSGVNFRSAPSLDSRVLGVIPRGTRIEVLEVVNQYWVKARYSNRTGYVSIRFLREVNGQSNSSNSNTGNTSHSVQAGQNVADRIMTTARQHLGTPYRLGAATGQTHVFDCSSFTQYVFRQHGIDLPRNSRQQSQVSGQTIRSTSQLQKGDLIFFKTGNRSDGAIDHVAIYMGNGQIIHAVPNGGVRIDQLRGFWLNSAQFAKRVIR
jgi:cell wall-associated NlpC family hydrolase